MSEWPENGNLSIELANLDDDTAGMWAESILKVNIRALMYSTENFMLETLIHEAGHAIEEEILRKSGKIKRWATDFLYSRTGNRQIRNSPEIGQYLEDKFVVDYVGAYYIIIDKWDEILYEQRYGA